MAAITVVYRHQVLPETASSPSPAAVRACHNPLSLTSPPSLSQHTHRRVKIWGEETQPLLAVAGGAEEDEENLEKMRHREEREVSGLLGEDEGKMVWEEG